MLKSKKGLYILTPIVAFIWGAIIFQIVSAFSDNNTITISPSTLSFTDIKTKEREQFSISTINRDPFLDIIYKPKKKITKNPKKTRKNKMIWPTITYKGLVSGQNTTNTIFLIEINGADQLMKIGDTVTNMKLIKGSTSTVRLRHKGKTKQFQISH